MFPIGGMPGWNITGVMDDTFVRVIALEAGDGKALIVAFDMVMVPYPSEWIPEICALSGVPADNILYIATHAHATYMIRPGLDDSNTQKYKDLLKTALLKAVSAAVKAKKPAKGGVGYGKSYININRNLDYNVRENGKVTKTCSVGYNAEGPIDRSLTVVRFDGEDGMPIAFFCNYPCHAVMMHMNECMNGSMGFSGDFPGLVSQYLEELYSGSIAVWSSGSSGDINPIVMNQMYYPSPKNGAMIAESVKGGDYEMVKTIAARHLQDILAVNDGIRELENEIEIKTAVGWSRTPGRSVTWIPDSSANSPLGAGKFIYGENGEDFVTRMQLFKVGDLTLLGIDGDLYTTISLHLKQIAPVDNLVIAVHADGIGTSDHGGSYIYDDDGINRSALHYIQSSIKPGYVKDEMAKVLLEAFVEIA